MLVFDQMRRQLDPIVVRVNISQDVAISRHFLFRTILWFCLLHHYPVNAARTTVMPSILFEESVL